MTGRWWNVFTRHRIPVALAQAGVTTAEGRVPTVIRTRPTRVGTRVTVWMPPGTALEQLGQDESVRMGIVRTACWAKEVRVEPSPRIPALVSFHLVRRDTLAPAARVPAVLSGLISRLTPGTGHSSGEPPLGSQMPARAGIDPDISGGRPDVTS